MNLLFGSFLVAVGAFSVFGGATGWEWFMSHRKAEGMVSLLGRTGARICYVLCGVAIIAFGSFFIVAWLIWDSR
jgi:hypothetical protein